MSNEPRTIETKARHTRTITTLMGYVCCRHTGELWCGKVHGDIREALLCLSEANLGLPPAAIEVLDRGNYIGSTIDYGDDRGPHLMLAPLTSDSAHLDQIQGCLERLSSATDDAVIARELRADLAQRPAPAPVRTTWVEEFYAPESWEQHDALVRASKEAATQRQPTPKPRAARKAARRASAA